MALPSSLEDQIGRVKRATLEYEQAFSAMKYAAGARDAEVRRLIEMIGALDGLGHGDGGDRSQARESREDDPQGR